MNGKLLMELAWSKSIEVYHPDIAHILRMSANPVLMASDFGFIEGLLWHKGGYLIFSDLVRNKIYKHSKQQGTEVFLHESGLNGLPTSLDSNHVGSNGIAYDLHGNFVFCQHGNHAIVRLNKEGVIEKIVDSFQGRRLNSPNDLIVAPDGSIYFTDPPYGLSPQKLNPDAAQPIAGIYRWFNDTLELVSSDFTYPNGLCFSPDCRYVYVSSSFSEEKMIKRYELEDGKFKNGEIFISENADGIKTDKRGNVFLATETGVRIFSSAGIKLGMIKIPAIVNNLCIEGNTLYIGTPHKLFRFALRSK
ncbi:MAG: SMP-30/gluconolactonase/LRE family protein [Cytophagaceae bacterium]|nr:SMP-30/gluconolactonase/LRE family protein [Cytophagaceae bacterium]